MDGVQLDDLWVRAEHEFKNLDWSLGNVLSWITFRDPLLICAFENRRDLVAERRYDFPRSSPLRRSVVVPLADRILLDALKEGPFTAIRGRAEITSTFWFGKQTSDLKTDLRFRRVEVINRWPVDIGEQAVGPSRTAGGCEMWEKDGGRTRKWQRERWRRDWIARFAERQRFARRWIAFVDLVDWGAHSTTAASANAEEQARELVYRRLSESFLRGAFDQAGRSKILYLDTLVTGDGASPRCRLTREQFEIAFKNSAAVPWAPSLPLEVLNRCWMSREVAPDWLESHGYRWPPHFESATKTVDARAGDSGTARITTSNPRKARPGPIPTAGSIKNTAEALIAAGRVPAKTITWEQFRTELCRNLKVTPEQRGYSLDTIQAVVRPLLLGDRIAESTESTEN